MNVKTISSALQWCAYISSMFEIVQPFIHCALCPFLMELALELAFSLEHR